MKTISLLAASIGLAPWLLTSALAQQELKVRSLSFQNDFPPEICVHSESGGGLVGRIQVKSFLNHEGELLKFSGGNLIFTRKPDPASATDVNSQLGKLEVPANLKSAILLFLPKSGKPGDFTSEVVAIDSSAKAFPPGSYLVANLGSCPVKIELEKETLTFAPGETRAVTKLPFDKKQTIGMRAYCQQDGVWKSVSSSAWANPGTKRVLQVFSENPVTKRIVLKGLRDISPP